MNTSLESTPAATIPIAVYASLSPSQLSDRFAPEVAKVKTFFTAAISGGLNARVYAACLLFVWSSPASGVKLQTARAVICDSLKSGKDDKFTLFNDANRFRTWMQSDVARGSLPSAFYGANSIEGAYDALQRYLTGEGVASTKGLLALCAGQTATGKGNPLAQDRVLSTVKNASAKGALGIVGAEKIGNDLPAQFATEGEFSAFANAVTKAITARRATFRKLHKAAEKQATPVTVAEAVAEAAQQIAA